jgi:outer membrane usher protein
MSSLAPATRRHGAIFIAGLLLASGFGLSDPAAAAPAGTGGEDAMPTRLPVQVAVKTPVETLIVRVRVNTVDRGNLAVLRDADGHFLVPEAEFARLGPSITNAARALIDGERYVPLVDVPGLEARFDATTVTLALQFAPNTLPGTTIDVGPKRSGRVRYPADTSIFLNYGLNAIGDESFGDRRYQAASELGARYDNWLLYSTSDYQWGEGATGGFTRLLTNAQYDDRPNLRRLTLGDFFTPTFDLSSSVPMAGIGLTKDYSMDPYFVQYPTAAFRTEVAFPSTVQVKVNGNVIDQRQVPAGPVDITNITTGVTGAQNVAVVIRDPFGREQVLQQPFFFATDIGLAQGLHEYSYNVGVLRENYGLQSNEYGSPALAAFHRYAFTSQLTLGLRGQAAHDAYNIGPFGTYQLPRLGVIAGGISVGGNGGSPGYAASAAYSYTGGNFSLNLGARYFSPDFAQLTDLTFLFRQRSNQYASASAYSPATGTLTVTYAAFDSYEGPQTRNVNLSYTLPVLGTRGLIAVNYLRTLAPFTNDLALLSFRYYLDRQSSAVAAVGAGRGTNTQSVSLQRTIPQGEGFGYDVTAGRASGNGGDGTFGRAFVQVNAAHAEIGAEYERSSRGGGQPGQANVFVAGSVGAVGGSVFAARPVQDSLALVRIPGLADVPVFANGWYAGRTNAAGEVVANNVNAYYENYISFGTRDLALDYVFSTAEAVISPPRRSGTLVTFEVRKMRAVIGALVEQRNGASVPLEFRELTLTRGAEVIKGFTARRGEFYVEGVEPGEYLLHLNGSAPCSARLRIPADIGAMVDIGTAVCVPVTP